MKKMQDILKEIYKDLMAKSKFEFNLVQNLTSSNTAFRLFYNEESEVKELKQYEMTKRIFPFDEHFL